MNNFTDQETTQSHLRFQMWDKYLTRLNQIWDLERTGGLPGGQKLPEQPATNFHATFWEQHLLPLNQTWHVAPTLSLAQPTSVLGKLLFPLKKLICRWMQPSIEALAQQQNNVNARLVQTCNGIVEVLNKDILHTISKLEAQKEFNARLVQTLNGLVELTDAEMTRLRKELQDGQEIRYKELQALWQILQKETQEKFQAIQMMIWTSDRYKEALEVDEVLLNQKLEGILARLRDHPDSNATDAPPQLPAPERQEDYVYVLFERSFRGEETVIKERQRAYLPYFQHCANVLDLGCGRGEFLELLREQQITGYGVDLNRNLIQACRNKGFCVEEADLFSHLEALPDNSLDGIFSAQLIEHCSFKQLYRLLQLCFEKLQFEKYLVLETQNPQSLYVLSHFYQDISHEKPIHPDALRHLVKIVGFQEIQVEGQNRFPPEKMLRELDVADSTEETAPAHIATLNNNIRQLNDMLYGDLDYAVIAQKVKMF